MVSFKERVERGVPSALTEPPKNCGTCARLWLHQPAVGPNRYGLGKGRPAGDRKCPILVTVEDLHLESIGGFWVRHFWCNQHIGQGEMIAPPADDSAPAGRRPRGTG